MFTIIQKILGGLSKVSSPIDWREIIMKQSVGKCKQINF